MVLRVAHVLGYGLDPGDSREKNEAYMVSAFTDHAF